MKNLLSLLVGLLCFVLAATNAQGAGFTSLSVSLSSNQDIVETTQTVAYDTTAVGEPLRVETVNASESLVRGRNYQIVWSSNVGQLQHFSCIVSRLRPNPSDRAYPDDEIVRLDVQRDAHAESGVLNWTVPANLEISPGEKIEIKFAAVSKQRLHWFSSILFDAVVDEAAPPARLDQLTPTPPRAGEEVVLNGSGFSRDNAIYIRYPEGGVNGGLFKALRAGSEDGTTLRFQIPSDVPVGRYRLLVNNGIVWPSNELLFDVIPPRVAVTLTGLTPSPATVGGAVILTGSGFRVGNGFGIFNSVGIRKADGGVAVADLQVTTEDSGKLQFTLPADLQAGRYTVDVYNWQGGVSPKLEFLVVSPAPSGGGGGGSGVGIGRELMEGSVGEDVRLLQRILNMSPETQVASTGLASPGQESTYFGPATRVALEKWQAKYGFEVTGTTAPQTRSALNAMIPILNSGGGGGGSVITEPGSTPVSEPTPVQPAVEEPTLPSAGQGVGGGGGGGVPPVSQEPQWVLDEVRMPGIKKATYYTFGSSIFLHLEFEALVPPEVNYIRWSVLDGRFNVDGSIDGGAVYADSDSGTAMGVRIASIPEKWRRDSLNELRALLEETPATLRFYRQHR